MAKIAFKRVRGAEELQNCFKKTKTIDTIFDYCGRCSRGAACISASGSNFSCIKQNWVFAFRLEPTIEYGKSLSEPIEPAKRPSIWSGLTITITIEPLRDFKKAHGLFQGLGPGFMGY